MLRVRGFDLNTEPLGLRTLSYNEPGGPPRITDYDPRKKTPRSIVFHSTSGGVTKLRKGRGPGGRAKTFANYQVKTDRFVSWDGTIDTDAFTLWQNDPAEFYSWSATKWNSVCMGIEFVEDSGSLYEEQILAGVLLADILTATFGIQRQIAWDSSANKVQGGVLPRADDKGKDGGASLVGVFAHFHNTTNRGAGDPGRFLFDALKDAGYECFDMKRDPENPGAKRAEDQRVWAQRQAALGITADGLPMLGTRNALKAAGKPLGMWVPRPCDAHLTTLAEFA